MGKRAEKTGRPDGLNRRELDILRAVTREYIRTVAPVGSKAVAAGCGLGLSPATVRGIMGRLETAGYLSRRHTSAGRVPTDASFRLYVDTLPELEELREEDKCLINASLDRSFNADSIMRGTARSLSLLSSCAGFILMPRPAKGLPIRHVRLVHVDGHSVLFVVVFEGGLVSSMLVRMDDGDVKPDLEAMSNYLNSMSSGLTMEGLRQRVLDEMSREKNLYDRLLSRALRLAEMASSEGGAESGEGLYLDGAAQMLNQPEFAEDVERMKRIFNAFWQKGLLLKILDTGMYEAGIHVYMGSECGVEGFEGLSFVTSPYGAGGAVLGTVGIIGPVRMNYPKVIPLVNYAAELLGRAL